MKKLTMIAFMILAMTCAFANIVTNNITEPSKQTGAVRENPTVDWSINQLDDSYFLSNMTNSTLEVFVGVNAKGTHYEPGTSGYAPADPVTVTCGNGKTVVLSRSSSAVCEVPPGDHVEIQAKQDTFKNGSTGIYSVIK